MPGFSVTFNEFDHKFLTTTGHQKANTPEGVAPAYEIPILYQYDTGDGKHTAERFTLECPKFKARKGVVPPMKIGTGDAKGKPAIQVAIDRLNDPDHAVFAGTLGNKHEYGKSKGRAIRKYPDYEAPSGVLGTIYDWSVNQYAKYLMDRDDVSKEEREDEDTLISYLAQATDPKMGITRKMFYTEVGKDGEAFKDNIALKFFKLMCFMPGTAEENMARFYTPDGSRIPVKNLYGQSFEFIPFLSFRRIWIGEKVSVTMEITEAVITDIFESTSGISDRSSRLIERIVSGNPEKAAEVAEKFKALMDAPKSSEAPAPAGCVVDVEPHKDDSDNDSSSPVTNRPRLDID